MAVPTVQAKGGLSALASGTTQSPTIPTHQADDILLAFVANNGNQTITVGGSWAFVPLTAGGTANVGDANFRGGLAWIRATGAGTTITFTHSAAGSSTIGHYAFVHVIRGCRTTGNPWDDAVSNGAPTTSNRPKHGANTSVTADTLYYAMALVDDDNSWNNTARTGFTEIENNTTTTGGDFLYYGLTKSLTTAQTQAQEDFVNTPFTMSAADYWVTFSLTLASLAADRTITSVPASMTLSAPTPAVKRVSIAVPGSLTLSAPAPVVKQRYDTTAPLITLNAPAPTIIKDTIITAPPGSMALSAGTPVAKQTVAPGPMSLTMSAAAPTLVWADTVVVPAGALITLSAAAPAARNTVNTSAPLLTLSAANQSVSHIVESGSALITMSAGQAAVSFDDIVQAPAGSLTLSAAAPDALAAVTITAPPGTLTLSGGTPVVEGESVTVIAPSGTLTLDMPAPEVDGGGGPADNNWFVLRRRRRVL